MKYIHNSADWPLLTWDMAAIAPALAEAKFQQGLLCGKMSGLDASSAREAQDKILREDALAACALDGLKASETARHDGHCRAMLRDALENRDALLTAMRLGQWREGFAPQGGSNTPEDDARGAYRFAFRAPEADRLPQELSAFLAWYNFGAANTACAEAPAGGQLYAEPLLRAGQACLWFMALRPCGGESARLCSALTAMLLHRADGLSKRFYSLAEFFKHNRAAYHNALRLALEGGTDITGWQIWFLESVSGAMRRSAALLGNELRRDGLRKRAAGSPLNPRQRLIFEALLDGAHQSMTTGAYARLAETSQDSALRDMQDMIAWGLLRKNSGGGRSTSYSLRK